MRNTIKRIVASVGLFCVITLGASGTTLAASPLSSVNCSGSASQSAFCQDKSDTSNSLSGNGGLLLKITNIVAIIAGLAAVVIIVIGGFRFVASGGSSEGVAGARRTIIYAIIGLVVIVLARTIIALVIGRL